METPRDPVSLGLPHREPFLFLDEVTGLVPGERGVATKMFRGDEAFFAGHFPGRPIVPGVLLVEAIAQLAGIVAAAAEPGASFLLTAVRQAKLPAAAVPGETLTIEAGHLGAMGSLRQYEGTVRAGARLVAEAQIVLTAGRA